VLLMVVQHENKQILHVVWRDITDRKRLEEQLRHSQKMEIIGQLTGGIAHDFNNLLVSIMGNGELLQRMLQDRPDLTVFVEEMVKAGRRGAALVRQLLLFGRPHDTPAEIIDLVPVLRDVRRMLERLIGENVRLVIESHDAPLLIRSTCGHIEQVVVNLVTNARDAMPDGGTVTVRLEPVSLSADSIAVERIEPGPYAILSVSDTGHGMSEAVLAQAIDPFFTTKEVGRGTGLGLATVYGIAKQSGGGLRIDSSVGHGSTVRVYLPLRRGEPVGPDAPALPQPTRGGTERIVVAEDDETVAKVVVRVLTAQGYRVDFAADGARALEICLEQADGVDLLVTDVVMPRMNGPELVRTLRGRGVHVPVLFMSGYTRHEVLTADAEGGQLELLEKPFTATDLVARVRDVLDGRSRGDG